MTLDELEIKVGNWAIKRGILKKENATKQIMKVMEEVGETAGAILKDNEKDIVDGIGDSLVTLIILAKQLGYTPQECLEAAWNEIKDREGKTINGIFVKDVD